MTAVPAVAGGHPAAGRLLGQVVRHPGRAAGRRLADVLAVLMVLNAAVAAFYYLRVVVYMYMRDPAEKRAAGRASAAQTSGRPGHRGGSVTIAIGLVPPVTIAVIASGRAGRTRAALEPRGEGRSQAIAHEYRAPLAATATPARALPAHRCCPDSERLIVVSNRGPLTFSHASSGEWQRPARLGRPGDGTRRGGPARAGDVDQRRDGPGRPRRGRGAGGATTARSERSWRRHRASSCPARTCAWSCATCPRDAWQAALRRRSPTRSCGSCSTSCTRCPTSRSSTTP